MKRMHILSIALLSMFAVCAVSAGSAFAVETTQWLIDGTSIPLAEMWNVNITAELLLEDMNATLKPDVLCLEVLGLQWLLSNGEGQVVELECMKVEVMTSGITCEIPKPLNLPWLSELLQGVTGGKEFFFQRWTSGRGPWGWEVSCTALGIKVVDDCTVEEEKTPLREDGEESESELEEAPENKEEEANCTVGGKAEGLQVGDLFGEALTGIGNERLALSWALAPEVS